MCALFPAYYSLVVGISNGKYELSFGWVFSVRCVFFCHQNLEILMIVIG